MANQHETLTVTFVYPRWHENAGETATAEMTQANFTTQEPFKFQEWELEAVNGMAYPKSEMVEYNGGWYLPEHLQDEIHDDTT